MKICLVSSGLEECNRRLQPWRYLLDMTRSLIQRGHDVRLISNSSDPEQPARGELEAVPITRLAWLQRWMINQEAIKTVHDAQPDVVLWHVGLTSFLRLRALQRIQSPVIGVFTSPIYRRQELLRLGMLRLAHGWRLSAVHLLGLLVPQAWIERAFDQRWIQSLIVECETTRMRLIERGVPGDRIHVIRPTIDPAWFQVHLSPAERMQIRQELGFAAEDVVVGYFGPPAPLRGLPTLIEAIAGAREENPRIKLLILSRRRDGELEREHGAVARLMNQLNAERWTQWVTGFLPQAKLARTLVTCDAIALPFQIVPSDVPLSVLEAMALGVPVITTQVVCLSELAMAGAGWCVLPGNVAELTSAISLLATDAKLRNELGRHARKRLVGWMQNTDDGEWERILKQ